MRTLNQLFFCLLGKLTLPILFPPCLNYINFKYLHVFTIFKTNQNKPTQTKQINLTLRSLSSSPQPNSLTKLSIFTVFISFPWVHTSVSILCPIKLLMQKLLNLILFNPFVTFIPVDHFCLPLAS